MGNINFFETLMKKNFIAKQIAQYIEDGIQTLTFSSTEDSDPDEYLILQRDMKNLEDDYYYEINSRVNSGYGGFSSIAVIGQKIEIQFDNSLAKNLQISEFIIQCADSNFSDIESLKSAIANIFQGSSSKLSVD